MQTHGRKVIYAGYTEKQLLNGSIEEQTKRVYDILLNAIPIHNINKEEIIYLQNYLYGDQDIKFKEKLTRTDINNKGVENWAWAFQDWKNAFLLGKPIQYASLDEQNQSEISILNKYNSYNKKANLDNEIYEDMFTVGRGYRYVEPSAMGDEDETPYNLYNPRVENTEVVYSNSIAGEQLLSFIVTSMQYIDSKIDPETGKPDNRPKYYEEYTVYTRNYKFTFNNKAGRLTLIDTPIPLLVKEHYITEYYWNRFRVGWLEIGKDIFDDINYVENLDKDDIESFVNAIMVFTNAEINKEALDGIKQYGAVSIKSTEQKKASVELLQSRLKSLDTQIYYLRKIQALHSILSVPQATNSGEISNAETGKATLTGQGFTSSSVRVEREETAFRDRDREALKVILKICRLNPNSLITGLRVSNIDIKFNRDLSENLLVKTQALMNLTTCQIPPEIRNAVIGLFSDPNAVTQLQEKFMEEQREINTQLSSMNTNSNGNDKINEQNNNIQDTIQKNEQDN